MGGDSDARRRLGIEAEAPATTAAPPLDPAEAASRLAYIGQWMRNGAYYIDQVEQEKDVAATVAGADALEQNQALRDQHATLEVHTAELHEALQRTKAGLNTALYWYAKDGIADGTEVEEIDGCRIALQMAQAVLAAPPPQRGRDMLAKVERYRAALQRIAERQFPLDTAEDQYQLDADWLSDARYVWPRREAWLVEQALAALDQGEAQEVDR